MIAQLRYNLKIVAPTLLWSGILVGALVALVLWVQFRNTEPFSAGTASSLAEQLVPVIAAFFSAGVLDAEMKRGAHELLRSKRRPLWHTVGYRVLVAVAAALLVGLGMLLALHFGLRRVPLGMILLACIPPSLCLALVSLWTRVRLGNAFIGYVVALAAWLGIFFTEGVLGPVLGIRINPLLTFSSYTDLLNARAAGAEAATPYVDWWWASKVALLVVSAAVFVSITRRVENLVEGD
ncbi:MAG: hypothetical protein ACK47B_00065 [Armatimonadota bacterium]